MRSDQTENFFMHFGHLFTQRFRGLKMQTFENGFQIMNFLFYEWMNEWMNEWSIYIALYCVLLYTQSALQSCGGVSPQPPPVCSIHLDDYIYLYIYFCWKLHHLHANYKKEYFVSDVMRIQISTWRMHMCTDM